MATKKLTKKTARIKRNLAPKAKVVQRVSFKKGVPKKSAAKKTAKKKNRGKADIPGVIIYESSELGAQTGGQSGDTQGLSGIADAESESVKELLEEGQSFEAEVVQGVESVPDADVGEVRTHEVPEDEVPGDYIGKDGQI